MTLPRALLHRLGSTQALACSQSGRALGQALPAGTPSPPTPPQAGNQR